MELKPFDTFEDTKGRICQVLLVAESDTTGERVLVYQRLDDPGRILAGPVPEEDASPDAEAGAEKMQDAPEEEQPQAEEEAEPRTGEIGPEEETAEERADEAAEETDAEAAADQEPSPEEAIDPEVEKFLDARTLDQKMDVLLSMRDHITNDQIDMMGMSLGLEIDEGDPLERFDDLRECLNTIARYELENARLR